VISSKEGKVETKGPEFEIMADLACVIKGLHEDNVKNGKHPLQSSLKILKYVVIGLTYKGDE
jgi:hypothetical protein